MGRFYPSSVSSRAELIEHLTESTTTSSAIHKCTGRYCSGNVLYTLWEPDNPEQEPFIAIFLMTCVRKDGGAEWGYTTLAEAAGPYYHACPLKYLDAAPVKNEEWRRDVRAYWKERAQRRKAKLDRKKELANLYL